MSGLIRDVMPEAYWRDVWHSPCPENNDRCSPMKHLQHTDYLDDGSPVKLFECTKCGCWRMAGLDAQRRVVAIVINRSVVEALADSMSQVFAAEIHKQVVQYHDGQQN